MFQYFGINLVQCMKTEVQVATITTKDFFPQKFQHTQVKINGIWMGGGKKHHSPMMLPTSRNFSTFFHPIIIIVDFFAKRQQFHGLESWNYFSFYDLNMIMHFLRNWEPTYSFWQK